MLRAGNKETKSCGSDIITALCEMPGGLEWGWGVAAMPQDSLHSIVMSPWKESGHCRVQRGSDGFHECVYP